MKNTKNTDEEMDRMEIAIGRIMRIGVAIAAMIMLLGYLMLFIKHSTGYPANTFTTTLVSIISGVIQLKPYALMMAGIFLLILTPALRVAASIYAFFKAHDTLYTIITVIVLAILIISFFLGHADY